VALESGRAIEPQQPRRQMPGGAEIVAGGAHFRVWAPRARGVTVVFENQHLNDLVLEAEGDGYFSGLAPARAGALYRYRLDDRGPYPDPYSRFQPSGPHGPSMIVDAADFRWEDAAWRGLQIKGQVIYELHVGAFTPEGTFDALAAQLPELKSLGITCIELMPVAEFAGRFNWGYDGVDLFAPFHGYGDPHGLRRLVNAAHAECIGVILDVVYNHLGPEGNYLACFSPDYFTDRYPNEWGEAINFDGCGSGPVRELFSANAAYWMREFHLDGLRLDATQSIHDASPRHVIAEITASARRAAAPRSIIIVAENEPQRAEQLGSIETGGLGIDAMWNDDFHHSARVALTGRHDGYFCDHRGRAQEFISAVKYGFLFQGQFYTWQDKARGTPSLGQPAWAFVGAIQNHDQVANTFYGLRLHQQASANLLRSMTALLLLAPHTPMLFMGQEFAATQPFAFFADSCRELQRNVHAGRRKFVRQFAHYATAEAQARVLDPCLESTFEGSRLDFSERERHREIYRMHRDLLQLRRDPVIERQDRTRIDGAVLAEKAFVLRWFDAAHGDRLLLVNFGDDLDLRPAPEPLLAPPRERRWQMIWSSDEVRYGGAGALHPCRSGYWRAPGQSATLLRA
jgi:maltooligosyltrehalose trehalohydrolase